MTKETSSLREETVYGSETNPREIVKPQPPCPLRALNYDILCEIIESLQDSRELRTLSMTCKWIREACKPCLFRNASIMTYTELITGKIFQHSSDVWLYVRQLTLLGPWEDVRDRTRIDLGDLRVPFAKFLAAMPRLETIILRSLWSNGMPWDAIATLLSTPRLRHFSLKINPSRQSPFPGDSAIFTAAPLESFEYTVDDYRYQPRVYIGETSLLNFVLPRISSSLKCLRIPLDVAPLSALASSHWPALQELSLRGDHPGNGIPVVPMSAVISNMPNLKSLSLLRAQRDNSHRQVLWPHTSTDIFPCKSLQSLTISYPDPSDRLFLELPCTLRQLSVRCWPRHYIHQHRHERKTMDRLGWRSPILTSSEVLVILERARSAWIEELEIEYQEDDDDPQLLRRLPILFPGLLSLTVCRYRRAMATEVPIDDIARSLSRNLRLDTLWLHLDLPNSPHPLSDFMSPAERGAFDAHEQLLCETAGIFASRSPASLRYVGMLLRERWSNTWLPFRVIRDRTQGLHLQLDHLMTRLRSRPSMDDGGGPRTNDQLPNPENLCVFEF
ncbi:hypothetical protein BD414DRAFT_446604 [Trametes punicea]|nr:hypothetical protein BD414DRAFT_446604 [Trametes punicea]